MGEAAPSPSRRRNPLYDRRPSGDGVDQGTIISGQVRGADCRPGASWSPLLPPVCKDHCPQVGDALPGENQSSRYPNCREAGSPRVRSSIGFAPLPPRNARREAGCQDGFRPQMPNLRSGKRPDGSACFLLCISKLEYFTISIFYKAI